MYKFAETQPVVMLDEHIKNSWGPKWGTEIQKIWSDYYILCCRGFRSSTAFRYQILEML